MCVGFHQQWCRDAPQKASAQKADLEQRNDALHSARADDATALQAAQHSHATLAAEAESHRVASAKLRAELMQLTSAQSAERSKLVASEGALETQRAACRAVEVQLDIARETCRVQARELAEAAAAHAQDAARAQRLQSSLDAAQQRAELAETALKGCAPTMMCRSGGAP